MALLSVDLQFAGFKDPNTILNELTEDIGYIILDEIEELMREPKSGRIYGSHQASAPGEAPAMVSEDLFDSHEVAAGNLQTVIESDLGEFGYGSILQDFMDRPWVEPAVENSLDAIGDLIERRLSEGWLV